MLQQTWWRPLIMWSLSDNCSTQPHKEKPPVCVDLQCVLLQFTHLQDGQCAIEQAMRCALCSTCNGFCAEGMARELSHLYQPTTSYLILGCVSKLQQNKTSALASSTDVPKLHQSILQTVSELHWSWHWMVISFMHWPPKWTNLHIFGV